MSPHSHALQAAAAAAALLLAVSGCGSVEIAPEPVIPQPIVRAIPARAAVVLTADQRSYKHSETRAGVEWQIALGAGHERLAHKLFEALFEHSVFIDSLEAARSMPDLDVIFEPRMEQYSFATANETGGGYYAVTIRYRVNVYAPDLQLVDSYTITGYGNSRGKAMSSSEPLAAATRGAMRDAAAKFFVQFPQQSLGQRLARGEPLVAPGGAGGDGAVSKADAARIIEAVPVIEREHEAPPAVPEQPTVPPANAQPKAAQAF